MQINLTATHKKVLWSILAIVFGVLAYTSTLNRMLDQTFLQRIDNKGDLYLDEALERSIYTFAIVRGLNGVISVIQNTQVAISPAGVGVSLAAGEILDPVNDLLERFSWVMMLSTCSLGLQKVLNEIGAWLGFDVLLTLAMLIMVLAIWVPRIGIFNFRFLGYRILLVSLIVRFCIPIVAIASDKVYNLFLADKYSQATQSLGRLKKEIKDTGLADSQKPVDDSVFANVKKYYQNATDIVQLRAKIDALKDKVGDYARHTIDLTVVFVIQTILIPLLVLWLLMKIVNYFFMNNVLFPTGRTLNSPT
ncbi:hypothetical protein QUF90_09570 [Desulfococcaceae bacterium HSG9]|nr:hypothetical protein [Desulfococcaceae bacterium HSG9]